MNKRILYISIDGMTDPLGQSQVLPYLGGLAEEGYEITLLSCDKPDRFIQHKGKIEDICAGFGITWHSTPYKNSPPVVSALANIQRLIKISKDLQEKEPFGLIHCRSYLPMFAGLALKKRFGVKVLFDIRGFWPDERVDGGLWPQNKWHWKFIYRYFKGKEKLFFAEADHVISLTENAKQEILSWNLKEPNISIDVIPCCADLNLFNYENIEKEDQSNLLTSLDLNTEDFIVTYLGSLGTFYGLEEMLNLFKEAIKENSRAKFLIITASDPNLVWDKVIQLSIPKEAIRVTRSERKKVPLHLSLSQFSLVFYKDNFSRKACSPTKIGELLGLGVPFICSPNIGDTSEIALDTKSGTTIRSFTQTAYKEAIEKVMEFSGSSKAEIRKGAFKYFDLLSGIEKYKLVYSKLLK